MRDRSKNTSTYSATPIISALATATGGTPCAEDFVETVQTDFSFVRTEGETFKSKENDYKFRVQSMDADSKRTQIAVSALTRPVEELGKENEKLQTENLSRTKRDEELATKQVARVPITSARDKKHKLLWSLPRICYGFATDLEKDVGSSACIKGS